MRVERVVSTGFWLMEVGLVEPAFVPRRGLAGSWCGHDPFGLSLWSTYGLATVDYGRNRGGRNGRGAEGCGWLDEASAGRDRRGLRAAFNLSPHTRVKAASRRRTEAHTSALQSLMRNSY